MSKNLRILASFFALSFFPSAHAEICKKWEEPSQIGRLPNPLLHEASGLAISGRYPDRVYHINDSTNGPYIYVTDPTGKNARKLEISGFTSDDTEDLSIGPCGKESCVFVADTGDNDRKRKEVEIVVIKETATLAPKLIPSHHVRLKYPDRPHNAEAVAVHPLTGDLYIITKEGAKKPKRTLPAQVFTLKASELNSKTNEIHTLTHLGEIDTAHLLSHLPVKQQLVTSFSITPNGSSFLILTLGAAIEFGVDLNRLPETSALKEFVDYSIVSIGALEQQEAVDYLPSGRGFVYSTESKDSPAPLMQTLCK